MAKAERAKNPTKSLVILLEAAPLSLSLILLVLTVVAGCC